MAAEVILNVFSMLLIKQMFQPGTLKHLGWHTALNHSANLCNCGCQFGVKQTVDGEKLHALLIFFLAKIKTDEHVSDSSSEFILTSRHASWTHWLTSSSSQHLFECR